MQYTYMQGYQYDYLLGKMKRYKEILNRDASQKADVMKLNFYKQALLTLDIRRFVPSN